MTEEEQATIDLSRTRAEEVRVGIHALLKDFYIKEGIDSGNMKPIQSHELVLASVLGLAHATAEVLSSHPDKSELATVVVAYNHDFHGRLADLLLRKEAIARAFDEMEDEFRGGTVQ